VSLFIDGGKANRHDNGWPKVHLFGEVSLFIDGG
jgi:hypothetical protein